MEGPIAGIAVAVNTFYPEFKGGYYFDHELMCALSNKLIDGNSADILYKGAVLSNFQEVVSDWQRNAEIDDPDDPGLNDIFDEITIRHNGRTIRRVFGIVFYNFGGPEPYHDSTTLEIFLHPADCRAVKGDLRKVMDELSCEYVEISGETVPSHSPLVRLQHFLHAEMTFLMSSTLRVSG